MGRFILDQTFITFLPSNFTPLISHSESGLPIYLANYTLSFDIPHSKNIHPDIIALICLITWYPYIKNESSLTFPNPVSKSFLEVLKLHNILIEPNSITWTETQNPRSFGSNNAISWGGGFDTWATYQLQPHLYQYAIHQIIPNHPIQSPEGYLTNNNKTSNTQFIQIATNCRSISYLQRKRGTDAEEEAGWTNWIQVLLATLWVTDQYDLGLIALGGNLGSVFLKDGNKYHPTHLKPNIWYQTLNLIGLNVYLPLAGLTDFGILKILQTTSAPFELIKYCSLSETVENCHSCTKCLRKELLLGREINIPLDLPGPSIDYLQRGKREVYSEWIDKYYQCAFELLPPSSELKLKSEVISALHKVNIDILDQKYNHLIEHYGWEL